mgnify:CR=1 FL=1
MLSNENTIIFHHIPKTAGTTFRSILERQYNVDNIYEIWGDKNLMIKNFKIIPQKDRFQYKLIYGHQALKLYDYVNKPVVITMLRSPVDRIISLYRYVKGFPWHPFYSTVNKYSLKECFQNEIFNDWTELCNGQFNSIKNSFNRTNLWQSNYDISTVQSMIDIFHKDILFGLVEFFDESLIYFNNYIGFTNHIYYYKQKLSRKIINIDEETIEMITQHNLLDIELYQTSVKAFNQMINSYKDSDSKQLERFIGINKYASIYLRNKDKIKFFFNNIYSDK